MQCDRSSRCQNNAGSASFDQTQLPPPCSAPNMSTAKSALGISRWSLDKIDPATNIVGQLVELLGSIRKLVGRGLSTALLICGAEATQDMLQREGSGGSAHF